MNINIQAIVKQIEQRYTPEHTPPEHGIYKAAANHDLYLQGKTQYYNIPPQYPTKQYGMNPTLFYQFIKQYPDGKLFNATDWKDFNRVVEQQLFLDNQQQTKLSTKNYFTWVKEEERVLTAMTQSSILNSALKQNSKIIANYHLDKIDDIGHANRFGSQSQINHISYLDHKLANIIQKLIQINHDQDDLMIVIVSDHGGIKNTRRHSDFGTKSKSWNNKWVKNVPMIFLSSGIKGRNVLQGRTKNINFAATVAKLMNFDAPPFWQKSLDLTNCKIYRYQV